LSDDETAALLRKLDHHLCAEFLAFTRARKG